MAACSDDPVAGNPDEQETILTISYSTEGYGAGLSRSDSEETLCWSDWNEKRIETLDLYLLNDAGVVTFYKAIDDAGSNDCNVTHTLLEFKEGAEPIVDGLDFETLNAASQIALVANYQLTGTGERVGKDFKTLYSANLTWTDGEQMTRKDKFIMVGTFKLPAQISRYSNIVVPLRRVAAKIRLSLLNTDGSYTPAADFYSILCRYSLTGRVLPDERMPSFRENNTANPGVIYPTLVNPSGPFAGTDWSYPLDLTERHPDSMVRDNGHVYYTCPADWVDYSKVMRQCNRNGQSGHKNHNDGSRFEVANLDDTPCVDSMREMFLLVKAPYKGHEYFYRVPVNYRLPSINDQQCYSAADLADMVFSLYRAERNCFYDITAFIDREGAATPEHALDPAFAVSIAPMEDGGSTDYYYRPPETETVENPNPRPTPPVEEELDEEELDPDDPL